MAAHRYWRVLFTAVNGSTIAGLTEVELRATPGGSDQTGPGLGTAISGGDFGGSFVKANAFDNTAAEWASPFPSVPGAWIGWDFGVGVTAFVREVVLKSRTTDPTNGPLQAPRDFSIEWSDDQVTWNSVWTVRNQTGWALAETRTFTDPVPAGSMGATKSVVYSVLGPPLLLSSTKSVMYVITGPDNGARQRLKVRYVKSHE